VTNFLFPLWENYIVTVMQDVTITVEIGMKSRKFLTKYDYILNMHKIIKCNNNLEILGWHLLLFITNSYQINIKFFQNGMFSDWHIHWRSG